MGLFILLTTCVGNQVNLGVNTSPQMSKASTDIDIPNPISSTITVSDNLQKGKLTKTKGGDIAMYGEWNMLWVILCWIIAIGLFTELAGNGVPGLKFVPKKWISVGIGVLIELLLLIPVLHKLITSHSTYFLILTGFVGWYGCQKLWADFINFEFWKGWGRKN
jgi:hypothetical protein